MERIKAACLRYTNSEGNTHLIEGVHHSRAYDHITYLCTDDPEEYQPHSKVKEGFITTEGRFVDRVEAMTIAKAAGQVSAYSAKERELKSYMLH